MGKNQKGGSCIANIAIYLRKSRADDADEPVEETLERHRKTLLEFAEKNALAISEQNIYKEVVSGDALYARPEMLRLLKDVEAEKFNAVLCMDIDRLGRGSMAEQGIILETFKTSGTKIMTPVKTVDLDNDADEDYTEFKTFLSRQELKMIKRRLKAGTQRTIKDGGYIANAPYGYEKAYRDKKPTLKIKEDEAKIVRLMFRMYVEEGAGCQMIAETVNAMGARPRRSDRFGRSSVMKILKNNVYIGKIVWNQKTHLRKGSGKSIAVSNPKEKWIITDGIHPPIVDEELFEKAQEIFERRQPAGRADLLQKLRRTDAAAGYEPKPGTVPAVPEERLRRFKPAADGRAGDPLRAGAAASGTAGKTAAGAANRSSLCPNARFDRQ